MYLVYALRGGPFNLDLSEVTGTYRARWFDPRTGALIRLDRGAVSGGGVVEFDAPDDQDWALWLSAPCVEAQTADVVVVSEQSIVTPVAEVSCAQIFAGPSLNIKPGGGLTLQAPLVTLVDGFSVELGGKLAIGNATPVPNTAGSVPIN
jgi:hypothetical protein